MSTFPAVGITAALAAVLLSSAAMAGTPADLVSRLQSDMERVAVLGSPRPLAEGAARDPLERLVGAVDALRRGRELELRGHAALVRAEALRRLAQRDEAKAQALAGSLAETPRAPPLLALLQAMRLADEALASEQSGTAGLRRPRLRLPCRLVIGRLAEVEAAARQAGMPPGELLSCPVPEAMGRDFAALERLARRPAMLAEVPPPPRPPRRDDRPPPPPWDHGAAIRFMADNPDGVETPLRLAMLESQTARLDLALFLHAFREASPARDDEIRLLMAGIERSAQARADERLSRLAGAIRPYDGTDSSLVPGLRLAALTGIAEVGAGRHRYPYAIPCAVLQRRPDLAQALVPAALADDDAPPPVVALSGCLIGRGIATGFPEAAVATFVDAVVAVTGEPLPRYPLPVAELPKIGRMLTAPGTLLAEPPPLLDHPYQTWAYASLANHAVVQQLRPAFETARDGLAAYYRDMGLSGDQAVAAARQALFALAPGSTCGDEPPPRSLRRLLVDGAPLDAVAAALDPGNNDAMKPFTDCAALTPFDPLSHVAAGYPTALALLWEMAGRISPEAADLEGVLRLREIEARNSRGETALMVAARAGRINAVRFLLDHGAQVEAGGAAGSALARAAASGSLALIRMLLEAGSDRFQADGAGLRAIDHLLGHATGQPNPVLGPAERAEAARLLF